MSHNSFLDVFAMVDHVISYCKKAFSPYFHVILHSRNSHVLKWQPYPPWFLRSFSVDKRKSSRQPLTNHKYRLSTLTKTLTKTPKGKGAVSRITHSLLICPLPFSFRARPRLSCRLWVKLQLPPVLTIETFIQRPNSNLQARLRMFWVTLFCNRISQAACWF